MRRFAAELLLPALRAGRTEGGTSRVVLVTSGGMYTQALPADDDLEYERGPYSPSSAYARSKRVQVEMLEPLAERWRAAGLEVHATHPGWADTPGVAESLPGFQRVTQPVLRDAVQGADTTVWLVGHTAPAALGPALARPAQPAGTPGASYGADPRPGRGDLGVGPHRRAAGGVSTGQAPAA